MAAVASPRTSGVGLRHSEHMSDTTDTRTRTPSPVPGTERPGGVAGKDYQPDLSAEVAMLSTKLVNAINSQTNLDDSLQQTRHELDQAQQEVARIRAEKKETDDLLTRGVLVKRAHMDMMMNKLREDLAAERAAREAAEKAKKETEGELETLTTALFEEANTMVAAARRDAEAMERRNTQLKSHLADTELLLASQTEQLHDLKGVLERMDRASEHDGAPRDSSMPSTPVNSSTAVWDALQLSPNGMTHADVLPDHPLHFSQLLTPVLRNDISAYTDFQELLSVARRTVPHSRNGSSSANLLPSSSQTNLATSSPSLPGAFSFAGAGSSTSNSPLSSSYIAQSNAPPLKESKFYKRAMLEDIEPTLRLDLAPGLSFLSRRTVLSSLLSGSLVVEPFMPSTKFYGPVFACGLCGENRRNEPYIRKHRFRTSEEESAARYPLCDYCLGRIRAAGDFVGFLRMVRDGHWRCESDEEAKGAWEEAVRLRERMFWARLGGGVVPVSRNARRGVTGSPGSTAGVKSSRASLESTAERSAKKPSGLAGATQAHPGEPSDGRNVRDERTASGTGSTTATGGMLSSAAATATEDAPRQRPTPQRVQTAVLGAGRRERESDSASLQLPAPDTDTEGTRSSSPFEDAQSDSQEDQAQASRQLLREADAASNDAAVQAQAVPIVHEPSAVEEAQSPADVQQTRPTSDERRPSAVLARVRAMEASSTPPVEKKLPGAFE